MDVLRPYETPNGTWWPCHPWGTVVRMAGPTLKRTVTVWDKVHPITVQQESKTVWVAVGDYRGERLEVKGKTDTQAVAAWRDVAKLKGR